MLLEACFIVIEIKRLLGAMRSKNKRSAERLQITPSITSRCSNCDTVRDKKRISSSLLLVGESRIVIIAALFISIENKHAR